MLHNYWYFLILEQCLHLRKHWNGINEGDPPFGTQNSGGFKTVRSTQRDGTQYAEILLYRTQTSIFTFEKSSFHQETHQT